MAIGDCQWCVSAFREHFALKVRAAQFFPRLCVRQGIRRRHHEPQTAERACNAVEAIARAEKYLDTNVTVSLVLEQLGGGDLEWHS
jgi:hypothetical protein